MIGMGDEIRIHVFSLRQEWLFNTFQTNFFRESCQSAYNMRIADVAIYDDDSILFISQNRTSLQH